MTSRTEHKQKFWRRYPNLYAVIRGWPQRSKACAAGTFRSIQPTWRELGVALRVLFYPHPEVVEHSVGDVSINVPVNDRQQWFLDQLAAGRHARASDLAAQWGVSEKTAKRDIAYLKGCELIEFVGSPKKGFYRIRMQV